MTAPETPQLMLAFEPGGRESGEFLLRVSRSEREFFLAREQRESYVLRLPRPFQETAFMDEGGWRRQVRAAGPAQDLGYRMWTQLPPSVVADIQSGTPAQPRRVAIVSRSTGVDDVPWEWLNPGVVPPGPIATADHVRFVRLVPSRFPDPPITVTPPLRILTVMSNPKDERLLIPSVERQLIMQKAQADPRYEVRHLEDPRMEALIEALQWSPHIVHYVGHAGITGQSGAIILLDQSNGTRWVTAAELANILPASVRLLCLSTCVTAENYQVGGLVKIPHSPNDIALPTTIVNQYAIEQQAAGTFWGEFYPSLLDRDGDVGEAFHRARHVLSEQGGNTWSWASFSLVVRDGTGCPFRVAAEVAQEREAAEIQAQWATRIANTLATRMSTLNPGVQHQLADAVNSEEQRIDFFRGQIDKY
jgi:hypothetical protein